MHENPTTNISGFIMHKCLRAMRSGIFKGHGTLVYKGILNFVGRTLHIIQTLFVKCFVFVGDFVFMLVLVNTTQGRLLIPYLYYVYLVVWYGTYCFYQAHWTGGEL